MKPRSLCALVLALALPALGQSEPQIEPLVPPNAPWLQKNQKKSSTKKKAKKPPEAAQKEPGLPPLEPLTLPPPPGTVGVLVQGPLPEGAAKPVSEGLQAVAKRAPGVKEAFALDAPQPCADEACWVTAGIARQADRVIVAAWNAGAMRLRLIDVKLRKQVSEAQQGGIAPEPSQVTASAEALACKLLVPAGCTGVAIIEAPAGIALEIDGRAVRPHEKTTLPVGVHALRIRDASGESSRPLPVLVEGTPPVQVTAARPPAVAALSAPAAAVTASPTPTAQRKWTTTAGYAAAGAAVLAAGVGAYFGLKSKSEIDSAESAYRANGNAWTASDLDTLHSGNSKAQTANALFIASGVLLAAGAALTFAF